MSKAQELLQACKVKLNIESDYALSKALEIHTARISAYMHGKETPDAYACTRIALILNREPIEIIAEIEAETAKNPARKTFWRDFLQRAKLTAQLGALAVIFGLSLLASVTTAGGGFRRSEKYA